MSTENFDYAELYAPATGQLSTDEKIRKVFQNAVAVAGETGLVLVEKNGPETNYIPVKSGAEPGLPRTRNTGNSKTINFSETYMNLVAYDVTVCINPDGTRVYSTPLNSKRQI